MRRAWRYRVWQCPECNEIICWKGKPEQHGPTCSKRVRVSIIVIGVTDAQLRAAGIIPGKLIKIEATTPDGPGA